MKIISNHFKYASNVWLTSAILTPCFFAFFSSFSNGSFHEIPVFLILVIPIGIIFSLPNYYFLFFCVWKINQTELESFEKKIIINIISIALTFFLFFLIFHNDFEDGLFSLYLPLAYSATLTFGVWIFNLDRQVPDSSFEKKRLPKIKTLDDILDDEIY